MARQCTVICLYPDRMEPNEVKSIRQKLKEFEEIEKDVALYLNDVADYIYLNNKRLNWGKVATNTKSFL